MRLVAGRPACPIAMIVSDLGCAFYDVEKNEREIAVREMGGGPYSDEGRKLQAPYSL